jgi:adenylate cyclase
MTRSEQWRLVLSLALGLCPLAALIGLVPGYFLGDGNLRTMITGGFIGLLIGLGMVAFQVSWGVGLIPNRIREAPFLVVLFTVSFAWLVIIVVGLTIPLVTVGGVPFGELTDTSFLVSTLISFVVATALNFGFQVNRMMGRGVLLGLISGRYHRPHEERRVFLFVDLRGSTTIAEQLGNVRYHELLRRFIADITAPVIRNGGDIHRYVGDQVIVTWTERRGIRNAACIRAYFGMIDAIDQARRRYQDDFGLVPTFWAGLHLGPVIAGEVGAAKYEIVFLGDTMNIGARIEQHCRAVDRPCLASGELIEALDLPADVSAESLGATELRGIGTPVELYALSRGA